MSSSSSAGASRPPRRAAPTSTSAFPSPLTPRSSFNTAVVRPRVPGAELLQRAEHILLAADVEAARVRHVLVVEDAPAPALRPEPLERRIGAVERDPEANRELHLVRRGGERQQERQLGLPQQRADPRDRARAREQLPRQRLVPPVDERDDREAAARLRGVQLGHEAEVVVDEPRQDRLGGDVDHARARRAEQAEHETEEALLVGGEDRDQLIRDVHADRVDDDHRPLDVADRAQRDRRPQRPQPLLELGELVVCHRRNVTSRRPQW